MMGAAYQEVDHCVCVCWLDPCIRWDARIPLAHARERAMEQVSAELARVQAERRRLQKLTWDKEKTRRLRRERAWRVATIAFCHVPTAGEGIATAVLRKYGVCIEMDVAECTLEIEKRFLETPVDKLAQWLDWTADTPQAELEEARRLVEEVRLLSWVQAQSCTQGVSPPPQFVWEKRCVLSIEDSSKPDARAASHRPPRSAGARKWVQRFRRRLGPGHGTLASKRHADGRHHASQGSVQGVKKCSPPIRNRGAILRVRKTDPVWVPRVHFSIRWGSKKQPFLELTFCPEGDGCVAMVSLPRQASATGQEDAPAQSR